MTNALATTPSANAMEALRNDVFMFNVLDG